jgi:hypothetical protein
VGVGLLKRGLCGAIVASLVLAPGFAGAACFTEPEWKAAHVRVFQTDLQVAALECANVAGHSYTDEYNSFIAQFSDRLQANAKLLKAHFQRVYGGASGRELDVFVTKVANDASNRTMQDMLFCANSGALFRTALAIEKPKFEEAAIEHVTDHAEIGEVCAAPTMKKKK